MAQIALHVDDPLLRLTAKAILEAEGHRIVEEAADLHVCADVASARRLASEAPVIVITSVAGVPDAVEAMRAGVHGYALAPLVPGELGLMVSRALAQPDAASDAPESDKDLTLDAWEARHILATLRRCRYNQAEAARRLGIGRNTLWRKLKRFRTEASGG